MISSCVNFVGVDLNTASVPLLRHVSGLNQFTARRIVDYRKEHGPFTQPRAVDSRSRGSVRRHSPRLRASSKSATASSRLTAPGSIPKATASPSSCSRSSVPRSDVVRDREKLNELRARLSELNVNDIAHELESGEFTLRDIIEALSRPERDPRDDLPKPIFKKGILKIEDLAAGMELKGTVLNVVDFGAFVDIGLKDSGLVHISQLANRYVKSPHDMVSVGDVVTVWVMGVDHERKRVSLTMVKPGTERTRGGPSGRRGGGPGGESRDGAPAGGRRGGARTPKPISSALTAPPVGAPSVAVLPETPPRRGDRDRPGSGPGGPRPGEPRSHGPAPGAPPSQEPRGGPPRGGIRPTTRQRRPARPRSKPQRRPPAPSRPRARRPQPESRAPPPRRPATAPVQGSPRRQRPPAHIRPAQAALGSSHR